MQLHRGTPDEISSQQVLKSTAGFYIGTLYWDDEMGGWFPNSRDSEYFPTFELAEEKLDA